MADDIRHARHVQTGGREVVPQEGEHGVRVRTVAVVEPVDAGGEPLGEGLEHHAGRAGRERGARRGVRVEEGAHTARALT